MSETIRIQPKFGKTFPEFSIALRQRVNDYFKTNNIDTDANVWMILKAVFYISLWIASFSIVLFVQMPFWLFILMYAVFGFSFAAMCVNVSHDVIHGAFSKNATVNNILKYTFDLCGASSYMWSIMHNQAHHTFTNIAQHDEDIHPVPILRLTPEAKHLPIHKIQWFSWFFIYPLATISWALSKDYVKLKENTVANYSNREHPKSKIIELFVFKFIYYALFIALPFIVIDLPWWQILIGFLLSHGVAGMYLGLIFMLAHCVENVEFPELDEKGFTEDSWFVHQMKTTANFSTKGKLASFISGGLNQQVEHHLFPNICSIHYPAISEIVKKTAHEYGVPYNEYPTFWTALKSHIRYLKRLSVA